MDGRAVRYWKELARLRWILIYFRMFKKLGRFVDLTFEEFEGRKNGYELHSRKNYWTLIGR
jgi:hypothetical protein